MMHVCELYLVLCFPSCWFASFLCVVKQTVSSMMSSNAQACSRVMWYCWPLASKRDFRCFKPRLSSTLQEKQTNKQY